MQAKTPRHGEGNVWEDGPASEQEIVLAVTPVIPSTGPPQVIIPQQAPPQPVFQRGPLRLRA